MAQALGSLQMGESVESTFSMHKYYQGDSAFLIVELLFIPMQLDQ